MVEVIKMHNLKGVYCVTETIIASPVCTTLKYASPTKCDIKVLVLTFNQSDRDTWLVSETYNY